MIRVEEAHIPVVADTHEGMKGKNNEDSFAVTAFHASEKDTTPVLLSVLSDGIGGHRAGEIASSIAVNTTCERIAKSDINQPVETIKEAIKLANSEIYAQSKTEERQGMGATISVVLIINNRLFSATIGDSRIYLVRNSRIQQVSTDHTWIQEALEAGLISTEQAAGHPNAHVIRRYLGAPKAPDVDIRLKITGEENDMEAEANQGTSMLPGDYLIQCSDGLTDLVEDAEILEIVQNNKLDQATKSMINLANERGGHDNITIIITHIPEDFRVYSAQKKDKRSATFWLGCAGLSLLGLIVLAGSWFFVIRPTNISQVISGNTAALPTSLPAVSLTPLSTQVVPTKKSPTPKTEITPTTLPAADSISTSLPAPIHENAVSSIAWSQDGSFYASASLDGTISIWDNDSGSQISSLAYHFPYYEVAKSILDITWNPTNNNQLASASEDGSIIIWDIPNTQLLKKLESRNTRANSIAWSPDGSKLAAGYDDGTFIIWDAASGAPIKSTIGGGIAVQSVAWKPDSTQLALAFNSGSISVWDINTSRFLPDMSRQSISADRLAWSTDGKRLVCGYFDGIISIWNMENNVSIPYLVIHENPISALVWKPLNNQFTSASIDGMVVFWDAATIEMISTWQVPNNNVTAFAWDPDGKQFATGSEDGSLFLWDSNSRTLANNNPKPAAAEDHHSSQPGSTSSSQED